MSLITSYTLKDAREKLETWKAALDALASGQAKEYKIGTREFKAIDIPEIRRQIAEFASVIEAYENQRMQTRVKSVVFRDL